jgi:hypothetical protein
MKSDRRIPQRAKHATLPRGQHTEASAAGAPRPQQPPGVPQEQHQQRLQQRSDFSVAEGSLRWLSSELAHLIGGPPVDKKTSISVISVSKHSKKTGPSTFALIMLAPSKHLSQLKQYKPLNQKYIK